MDDTTQDDRRFTWHPEYAGRMAADVRQELAGNIGSDQRQLRLAMEGAEQAESDALASAVTLERRWGPFDFDWAERDPGQLAERIVAFELERERRQEMISWSQYRSTVEATDDAAPEFTTPRDLSTNSKGLALLAIAVVIVAIVVILTLL